MKHFSELKKIKWDIYRVSNKHKEIDNIMCFDIEVSSFFQDNNGKIYSQNDILRKFKHLPKNERYHVLSNFFANCNKGCTCYIWQFGIEINGKFETYYGRELSEFKTLIDELNKTLNYRAIVYIHNSSYEMQFLRNIFDLENECETFFTDKRQPLYFRYGSIEFRCSYRLTNLSLGEWGKQIGQTQKTLLDYGTIRTSKTKLLPQELEYCENDILVMYDGLKQYREQYGYIANIPYTQTGKPRREIKKLFHNDKNYHEQITKELPLTLNEYKIQKRCYGGGLTIANAKQVKDKRNKIKIHKNVTNYDIASAYPFQMVTKQFPSGRFIRVNKKFSQLNFERYCYLMCIKIKTCKAKSIKHILPRAKIPIRKGCKFDNGKLVSIAKDGYAVLYCTEIDYLTYKDFYDFKENEIELIECFQAPKACLNKKFVEYILQLYANKTTLKDTWKETPENKIFYARLKEVLNACYGMACTSLVFEPIDLINNEWKNLFDELDEQEKERREQEIIDDLQKKPWKNITAFSMGIYVTSYQRATICRMLNKISDDDFLYTDTDSIKMLHGKKYKKIFEEENNKIIELIKSISNDRKIDINLFMPKDKNGKTHTIGLFEKEENYLQACFAGAKRYCYIDENGEFHITISGVPKCASKHCTIKDFQDGFIFDSEICEYKKNIVTYLDGNNLYGVVLNKGKKDEWKVKEKYGINMYPTGYKMSLEKDYVNYISELIKRR